MTFCANLKKSLSAEGCSSQRRKYNFGLTNFSRSCIEKSSTGNQDPCLRTVCTWLVVHTELDSWRNPKHNLLCFRPICNSRPKSRVWPAPENARDAALPLWKSGEGEERALAVLRARHLWIPSNLRIWSVIREWYSNTRYFWKKNYCENFVIILTRHPVQGCRSRVTALFPALSSIQRLSSRLCSFFIKTPSDQLSEAYCSKTE